MSGLAEASRTNMLKSDLWLTVPWIGTHVNMMLESSMGIFNITVLSDKCRLSRTMSGPFVGAWQTMSLLRYTLLKNLSENYYFHTQARIGQQNHCGPAFSYEYNESHPQIPLSDGARRSIEGFLRWSISPYPSAPSYRNLHWQSGNYHCVYPRQCDGPRTTIGVWFIRLWSPRCWGSPPAPP